ncbi:hypothetical protein [Dorea longicatena]|uniref:hypothetical protein n=1 Tax=Dorea longicatena TaxID=88431 RepID=UPI0034A22732
MRIISQDGCYDVPYESIILQRLGTSIFGVTTGLQESITIARYRKEAKAEKAMKMCRKKYAVSEFNRSVLCGMGTQIGMMPDNIVEVLKDGVCDKFTFQFPKDEEVE